VLFNQLNTASFKLLTKQKTILTIASRVAFCINYNEVCSNPFV